ncbi:hypothetical protein KY312_02100 [Candidatus Woesearchaeota archaeon]|nr:hypothetical protein [Candidatus Woesearchaeota archaeon]
MTRIIINVDEISCTIAHDKGDLDIDDIMDLVIRALFGVGYKSGLINDYFGENVCGCDGKELTR